MTTKKMIDAKSRALAHILESIAPPPRLTTPKASRERIRKTVEEVLRNREWSLNGQLCVVEEVVLDNVDGQRTLTVHARMTTDGLLFSKTIDEWMEEAE